MSCISPKDSVASRGMQNLTAKYNVIYNANILLSQSIRNIESGYIDNYAQLLTIYKEPSESLSAGEVTNLDSIIKKATVIVNEKLHSHYVDDAYLLVAKANYLKSQFFNAAEYFSYLKENYPQEHDIRQESLVWKARALLQLENIAEASNTVDTALKYIETSRKTRADVYATQAQLLITTGKENEAINALKNALDAGSSKQNEIRWRYILAQLQDERGQYTDAYNNFTAVVKSNAPFEMAFNANLNRIRIEDEQSGKDVDRITRLKSLLRQDKNKDFTDQIYYHIANIHFENNQIEEAIDNYNNSIRSSTTNLNQKGITYLKLADFYFDNADYVRAKAYYDSTVSTLSPKYPGYDLIRKKGSNLDLLAKRYQIIAREDTLQTLARLTDAQREERIGEIVRQQTERALNQVNQQTAVNNLIAGIDNAAAASSTEGKFYFNNTAAIGQGFSDFKRRWGNRRLEDNWRRVSKTAAESTQSMSTDPDVPIGATLTAGTNTLDPEVIRQNYLNNLPLTEPLMQLSNQRVAEAYYDIGNFYKDELRDDKTAIRTYEDLLKHSPQSSYTLPVYYNLYRLYQPGNMERSNMYRELILSKFPDSPFAKAIRDPNYSREEDEKERALNTAYNHVFGLYSEQKYPEVLSGIKRIEELYSNNKLSPQLAYLNTLAVGHTQKLPAFENALNQLITAYPNDSLITPLAKEHLQYIEANRLMLAARNTALLDFDPNRPSFVEEPEVQQAQRTATQTNPVQTATLQQNTPQANATAQQNTAAGPETNTPAAQSANTPAAASSSPFSLPGAAEYYLVINVTDPRPNLSSSRFGIGQFNRTRYQGVPLRHQLQEVNNENQLIFIGTFQTFEEAKSYENTISPVLKDIMKVPADQYTTFVITKESLEKLKNRQLIDSYTEFYKSSN